MTSAGGQRVARPRVTVFVAQGCHLCEVALETVRAICGDDVEVVDITGDPELETRHRERIPVVAVDGVERLVTFVDEDDLRAALGPA